MSIETFNPQKRIDTLNRILAECKRKQQSSEWDCDLSTLALVFTGVNFLVDLPFPLKLGIGITLAGVYFISSAMFDANTEAVDRLLTEADS